MASEIEFGDLEQAEPQRGLRPDQDAHFVVAEVGKCAEGELRIFVDLDVMRDMEAHARTDTQVELGGVMLGYQQVDDQGRPFVVITDSLRAQHYKATRGSFKFTHDTWSQISQERARFHPDLEMVGWYHTHPGWGVFLSGMDLFICDHFFNRPLDVALVIEPCADDRGWFQWTTGPTAETRQTGGFYLITGRHRDQELLYFARLYNHEPEMHQDPRYTTGILNSGAPPMVVNQTDRRSPFFDMAIVAMVLAQFLFLGIIGWKLLGAGQANRSGERDRQFFEEKLAQLEASKLQQIHDRVRQEMLQLLVTDKTGKIDLAQRLVDLRVAQEQLQSNLDAQMVAAESWKETAIKAKEKLKSQETVAKSLGKQLDKTRRQLETARQSLKTSKEKEPQKESKNKIALDWRWLALGGGGAILVAMLLGGGVGVWLGRRRALASAHKKAAQDGKRKVRFSQEAPGNHGEKVSPSNVISPDKKIGSQQKKGR